MRWSRERLSLVAAVLTNAAPIVGVAVLGWPLAAFVLVYWIELGVALLFAAVRALFARRPPRFSRELLVVSATGAKRGGLSIPHTDLRIQVANVPIVLVVVPAFGLAWLLTGGIAIGGLEQAIDGDPLRNGTARMAGFGILGVTLGRALETVSDYFLAVGYEDVNAQLALRSAVWPILVVGLALVAGGLGVATGAPTGTLIVAIVGAKLSLDLVGVYSDRLRAFDERTSVSYGWARDPPSWTEFDEQLSDPVRIVRPHPGAVIVAGIVRGVKSEAVVFPILVGSITIGLAIVGADPTLLVFCGGLAGGVLLLLAILGTLDRAIRYLAMEYRAGEAIVGYDRLFRTPQWRLPAWKVDRCEPRQTLPDRLFGTETIVVEHENRTVRLPFLANAEAIRSTDGAGR